MSQGEATIDRCGICPYERGLVITVHFQEGSLKSYDYFWFIDGRRPIEPGEEFAVIAMGQMKTVTVVRVRKATASDRLKRAHSRLDDTHSKLSPNTEHVYYNKPETTTMIKIENKTIVNGREFNDYSDHEILKLLRDIQKQIETLSELKPIPKRFARKIVELEAGRMKLIALLDDADAE